MNKIIDYDKEIIRFLKRNPRQMFSARELSFLFRVNERKICQKLKKLVKYDLIFAQRIDKKVAAKIYGSNFKRGLNLYCICED